MLRIHTQHPACELQVRYVTLENVCGIDRVAACTLSCPRAAGLHLLPRACGRAVWRQPNWAAVCMVLRKEAQSRTEIHKMTHNVRSSSTNGENRAQRLLALPENEK